MYTNRKYFLNTIFLQIININLHKNTKRNYLLNNANRIVIVMYDTKIKKIYLYDCSKITFDSMCKTAITNIRMNRGMHYININIHIRHDSKNFNNFNNLGYVPNSLIFYDTTKLLQPYFVYKIKLKNCIIYKNTSSIWQCSRNYDFLKNTNEFEIHNETFDLTNNKKNYHLIFVKNVNVIDCNIVYNNFFAKSFNKILLTKGVYFKIFLGKNYEIKNMCHGSDGVKKLSLLTCITNE